MSLLSFFGKKNGNGATPASNATPAAFRREDDTTDLPPLGSDGPLTLMAIMAHPDDIDFGSAGSIARWCAEGWTVYYVLATSGDKDGDPRFSPSASCG